MDNRIFCTFTKEPEIEDTVVFLEHQYVIPFRKIFVLYVKEQDDYLLTYNVENRQLAGIPRNTILVHRRKQSNTLYTINALNALIQGLNDGVLDANYPIDWDQYRNSLLLTKGTEFKKLNTKLYKIIKV